MIQNEATYISMADSEEVINHFESISQESFDRKFDLLPEVYKKDPRFAESQMVSLAIDAEYFDNSDYNQGLVNVLAQVRCQDNFDELPPLSQEMHRAKAWYDITSMRSSANPGL